MPGDMGDGWPERLAYHAAGYGMAFRVWGGSFGMIELTGGLPMIVASSGPFTRMEDFGWGVALLAGAKAEAYAMSDAVCEELRERDYRLAASVASTLTTWPEATTTVLHAMDLVAGVLVHDYAKAIAAAARALQRETMYLTAEDIDRLLAEEPEDEEEG